MRELLKIQCLSIVGICTIAQIVFCSEELIQNVRRSLFFSIGAQVAPCNFTKQDSETRAPIHYQPDMVLRASARFVTVARNAKVN